MIQRVGIKQETAVLLNLKNYFLQAPGPCHHLIYRNNAVWSAFLIEEELKQIENVKTGTCIQLKNKKIFLIIVKKQNKDLNLEKLSFPYDNLLYLKELPLDPRHQTKIDYKTLKNKIETKFS